MKPMDFVCAARVPKSVKSQVFGLWKIRRESVDDMPDAESKLLFMARVGFRDHTVLHRTSWRSLHLLHGEVVMEDSLKELRTHLPIWMHAKGNVLITGLGLGCVVRGLLENPGVDHVTVVEIDKDILRVVGHEFQSNRRCSLIHGDALKVYLKEKFDYAWHDLWTDGDEHLQVLHARLVHKFRKQASYQGAWAAPRFYKKQMPEWFLR